jgi:hypothetical protein
VDYALVQCLKDYVVQRLVVAEVRLPLADCLPVPAIANDRRLICHRKFEGLTTVFRRKLVPEQPNPEQDPITSKSYAAYYLIATVILIATLFWALVGRSLGAASVEGFSGAVERSLQRLPEHGPVEVRHLGKRCRAESDYAALKQIYEKTYQDSKAKAAEARKAVDDASARLLAVQSVFTDRRAYVNASAMKLRPAPAPRPRPASRKELAEYKSEKATVEFPDGSKKQFDFHNWKKTYNEIRDERTRLSLELGDVLKPVTAAKAKMDEYISDHMVDLTPQQIDGLKKKATEWDPKIVQINVAECQHRGPLRVLPPELRASR